MQPATETETIGRSNWLDSLDDQAQLSVIELLRSNRNPRGPISMSKSNWWRGVAAGVHPTPIRVGPKMTRWRAGDIRDWLEAQAAVSEDRASFKAPARKVLDRLQGAAAALDYTLTQVRRTDTAEVLLLLAKGDTTKVFNNPTELETFLAKQEREVAE
ncbi:MAG: hypothetical protein Q8S02_12390 [Hydrogenophaga sp.]|nr:hypothetical protein [Hydrogenophaga sp.]